jgi:aminoglycoside phosphotransferase (APT) family kinase protein
MSVPAEASALLSRLIAYLSEQIGTPVSLRDARPLSGGASRDTWLITAQVGDETQRYVVRRDLPTQMFEEALTREQEFRLMDAAYKSGVKVAKVLWNCSDVSVLGSPFFVMEYVPGISIGRKVIQDPALAHARAVLPQQMAEQLALIHKMQPDEHNLDFLARPHEGLTAAQTSVLQTRTILDELNVQSPTWEWCLRWADRHAPQNAIETFVHGDFRLGNLLVDESGLTAVIDWEFGHIGNPDEELGYVCMRDWRFGSGKLRFAGLSDRETFLTAYEQASGRTVDRSAVDWWEIMGNIRWGVICLSQANRHLSGVEPSVELASLGRRSAEMQYESLRLIQQVGL